MNNNYISSNIKFLRKTHNKTQKDIAKVIGVTSNAIGNYESGIRDLSAIDVAKIANYFNVSIDDFLNKDLSKEYNNIKKFAEDSEKEMLKEVLQSKGVIDEDEQLTQESFDKLIKFINNNKDMLLK